MNPKKKNIEKRQKKRRKHEKSLSLTHEVLSNIIKIIIHKIKEKMMRKEEPKNEIWQARMPINE